MIISSKDGSINQKQKSCQKQLMRATKNLGHSLECDPYTLH